MKKKIRLFSVAAAFMGMVLLAGCNSDQEASGGENTERVAVVLKTLSSPYWKYVEAGAKAAGKELGVDVTVVGPNSESEVMQQVNMIEDQLSQSPGALVVSPTQPDTVVPVLEGANIPVLLIDTDADLKNKTSFIGTENYEAGYEGGKLLASMLQKGDKAAIVSGALGNTATDERVKGAKAALKEAGIEVVAEQPADSDKTKAMSVMENILQKNNDIKGVFAANDDMALGVLRAVEAKGLDVKVIGTDGTLEAVESILAGKLAGTIAQSPYDMGYEGVKNALAAIKGKKVEKRMKSPVEVITKENAQEKLEFLKKIVE
ncbi:sugar ABC transporter substrate-binding protein [Anoxybacillus sp. UARK-01]|uniref:Sugar ABC transporter substrate-binding protein n=1 Tax=Anoxybacteroides rupiense TaxID=311460 RepID=A0ABD5IZY5_9BACL|nr:MULTISPECIES: sugar ABC transporter substrate-binding protein [Anoxybacillus]MED5053552.1 sugar ABC transporter substrate-binding protein [Anoxybacillus rupiensis]OQM45239.1 sugar ABC transporter substrate-binding protein [Anoxybacillus sp. UARK-01]